MCLPRFKITLTIVLLLLFQVLFSVSTAAANQTKGAGKNWAISQKTFEVLRDDNLELSLEKYTSTINLYWLHYLNESISGSEQDAGNGTSDAGSGAINLAGNYIVSLSVRPPVSSVEYLANLGNRLHLAAPAYAAQEQGYGYAGLKGILPIWMAFRNIAYALLIIIFVVVGFMIMFRAKLNPQTVVNLELALPKLIITLILITFSYAIAGFVLDLIYLLIYLAVNLTNTFKLTNNFNANEFFTNNFITFIQAFKPGDIAKMFGEDLGTLIDEIFGSTSLISTTGSILAVPLVKLIVGTAILFSLFKLLFQLIIAYVNIIIQVVFAPIMLLLNALPTVNTAGSWLKNLIANAVAFPATAIMILIGSALVKSTTGPIQSGSALSSGPLFNPPLLNFGTAGGQSFITSLIGLGIIMLLPKTVQMIQEALKAKPIVPAGAALTEGIGGAASALYAPIRSAREAHLQRKQAQYQAQQIGKNVNVPGA